MPPIDKPLPAMGTPLDAAVTAGASGTVNAKLRLMTRQNEDIKTLLAGLFLAAETSGLVISQIVSGFFSATISGDIGAATDPASTVGGSGSLNAKLRLVTQQLDDLKILIAETSGAAVTPSISGDIGAANDAASTPGGSGSLNAKLRLETQQLDDILSVVVAVSGDIGALGDSAVTGDSSGSISAKLRGLDKILSDVWDSTNQRLRVSVASLSGAVQANQGVAGGDPWPVIVSTPVGVSGDVNVHLPLPVGISGSVNIANSPTVGLLGPISVSGTVNTVLPLPVGISGTINVGNEPNVHLPLPVGISGTVNIGTLPDINAHLPLPVGVSGSVSIVGAPVPISGNVGINGTVNVAQALPLGVSGTVSTNVISLPLPIGVSGSVSIVGAPVPISGNVGINGTVSTSDTGVSGSVALAASILNDVWDNSNHTLRTEPISGGTSSASNVNFPLPVGVSGTVSAHILDLPNPIGVSGTLNTSVTIPEPLGVSGTVTVVQGTSPWSVSGDIAVTIPNPLGVSGDINAHLPLPIEVSGTVSSNVISLPLPVGVSGTVTANQGGAPWSVVGTLSHNTTAPTGSNVGVLPARATALPPTFLEGSQVLLSTDLLGNLRTSLPAIGILGEVTTATRHNQIEVNFSRPSFDASAVTNTTSNGGTATQSNGEGVYSTGTSVTAGVTGISTQSLVYRPGSEAFSVFTAAFTTPTASGSFQRIGPYTGTDGFFIGYEGLTFKVTIRQNSVDTGVSQVNFNVDKLDASSGSRFTRDGIIEALDWTKLNVFRIRWAWCGSAPILFEVLSPDSLWIPFHIIKQPNTSNLPSIFISDLNMMVEVNKTSSDATDLIIRTACWGAGMTVEEMKLTDTVTDSTLAPITRSVLVGHTTAGGGAYVNVKVNPSGTLQVAGVVDQGAAGAAAWPVSVVGSISGPVGVSGTVSVNQIALTLASSNATPITTATSTIVVAAPASGNHVEVKYIMANNGGTTATRVSWKEGVGGVERYPVTLPQYGTFAHHIAPDTWKVASATALYLVTSAAGSIDWTVEYVIAPD